MLSYYKYYDKNSKAKKINGENLDKNVLSALQNKDLAYLNRTLMADGSDPDYPNLGPESRKKRFESIFRVIYNTECQTKREDLKSFSKRALELKDINLFQLLHKEVHEGDSHYLREEEFIKFLDEAYEDLSRALNDVDIKNGSPQASAEAQKKILVHKEKLGTLLECGILNRIDNFIYKNTLVLLEEKSDADKIAIFESWASAGVPLGFQGCTSSAAQFCRETAAKLNSAIKEKFPSYRPFSDSDIIEKQSKLHSKKTLVASVVGDEFKVLIKEINALRKLYNQDYYKLGASPEARQAFGQKIDKILESHNLSFTEIRQALYEENEKFKRLSGELENLNTYIISNFCSVDIFYGSDLRSYACNDYVQENDRDMEKSISLIRRFRLANDVELVAPSTAGDKSSLLFNSLQAKKGREDADFDPEPS